MRYFFHCQNGSFEADEEGTECDSGTEARLQAILLAGSILHEQPDHVWAGGALQIHVSDEQGARVATVTIAVSEQDSLGNRPSFEHEGAGKG